MGLGIGLVMGLVFHIYESRMYNVCYHSLFRYCLWRVDCISYV